MALAFLISECTLSKQKKNFFDPRPERSEWGKGASERQRSVKNFAVRPESCVGRQAKCFCLLGAPQVSFIVAGGKKRCWQAHGC